MKLSMYKDPNGDWDLLTERPDDGSNLSHVDRVVVLMVEDFEGLLDFLLEFLIYGLWKSRKKSGS